MKVIDKYYDIPSVWQMTVLLLDLHDNELTTCTAKSISSEMKVFSNNSSDSLI